MTKDEALAMDLALEALKELVAQTEARLFAVKHDHVALQNAREAITAIKQARALDKKAENARELGLDYEPVALKPTAQEVQNATANLALMREMWGDPNQPAAKVNAEGFIVETGLLLSPGTLLYTIPPAAPAQEPVAFNAGVPPLYPEMKDGETISVEYTTPPGGRQSEDCLTAAQEDIQRLSALVRAQQITIDKLEQARSAPVQEPVTILPDGSAFGVMSFPLPDDHWLYAPNEYRDGEYEPIDLPKPILTHALREAVVAAVRYAVRGATMRGKETDFDPDALVQNAVYALCGPYTTPPAQPAPVQEPVATVTSESGNPDVTMSWWHEPALPVGTKLYTTPPAAQRQWVGLTLEQKQHLNEALNLQGRFPIIDAIEAKLKEKNGWYRQHVTDGSPCWCEPETSYTDPKTGASVIVHKEPQ